MQAQSKGADEHLQAQNKGADNNGGRRHSKGKEKGKEEDLLNSVAKPTLAEWGEHLSSILEMTDAYQARVRAGDWCSDRFGL